MFALAAACGVADAQAAEPSSTIVVDEAHSQFQRADGSEPAVYSVPAGAALEFDAGGFAFMTNHGHDAATPTLVSVLLGAHRKYRVEWRPGTSRYVLSAQTLRPETGSLPFDGFHAGDTVVLVVGQEFHPHPAPPGQAVKMLWGGLAKVR